MNSHVIDKYVESEKEHLANRLLKPDYPFKKRFLSSTMMQGCVHYTLICWLLRVISAFILCWALADFNEEVGYLLSSFILLIFYLIVARLERKAAKTAALANFFNNYL